MKRFFVMTLLVSTFFIGLGALIERGQASLKSDARAVELIRLARIAIGGEANIANVRSMSINARTTHFFNHSGAQQTETGSFEIAMQLPNQFTKMVRIGHPDEAGGNSGNRREVSVVVVDGGDGEMKVETSDNAGAHVMKMKKGDATWTDENGNDVKVDGARTITIKKGDGTVLQETKTGDESKTVIVDRDVKTENISGDRHNEMLRTMLALLLTAPEGSDVAFTYAGEGSVDGNSCNIVLAQAEGSSLKLFLDQSTNLPRMISYEGRDFPHIVTIVKKGPDDSKPAEIIEFKGDSSNSAAVEHQLKLSDFRSVEGLLLPFRWEESAGGKQVQTVDISGYEINPANIADKFKRKKVFVREMKPNQ